MATARMLAAGALQSATFRQFHKAVWLALAAVGLGAAIYCLETFGLGSRHRFVENPADVMMRGFGLAHFWVGWLFLFTSPRLRSWSSLGNLAFWTICGAALCVVSYFNGGAGNPFFLMAFYAYFLIHEVRDEATLFQACGDAPASPLSAGFLSRLAWSVTLTLMTLLVSAYAVHGRILDRLDTIVESPAEWLAIVILAVALLCLASWWSTARFARGHGLVWSDYAPLLAVYAGLGVLLGAGSLLGSFGFNLIVLLHVAAWFVFTYDRLSLRPAAPCRGWAWLRGTPAGFVTLHVAAALAVLTLMAVRVHLWERAGWVSTLFATSSFHYWSIMHITMAFWRGR